MKRAILYICYYNITEPLVQTQVVSYLRMLARRGIEVHLLTFEKERLSKAQQRSIAETLGADGIRWHWLVYHQTPSLPATLYDIVTGTITALCICKKFRIRFVHARSYVPAAMALLLKRLMGNKFLFDIRGLLADEYVDAGHWHSDDAKYRLAKRMEQAFFKRADAFVVLTQRLKRDLLQGETTMRERAGDIQVIPCCVDTDLFYERRDQRMEYRRKRGWDDRVVLVYVGKISPWYLPEEMVRFFVEARRKDSRFFFQILTQSDSLHLRSMLTAEGLEQDDFDIDFAAPSELPGILSACDASISFRKEGRSASGVSPTKVGESLAAGLPIVTSPAIGDCDTLEERNVGVTIREYSESEYQHGVRRLLELITDPRTPERCREFAETEFSLEKVGGPRYAAVYERMMGASLLAPSEVTEATRA